MPDPAASTLAETAAPQSAPAATASATRPAAPILDDLYFLVDVGAAIPQTANIGDIAATATTTGLSSTAISLDTGLRFDVGLGYQVTDWFAVEVASGLIWNQVNGVTGMVTDTTAATFGTDVPLVGGTGNLYSVPIMVNGQFRLPLSKGRPDPIELVLGAGVGGIWSQASVNSITASGVLGPPVSAEISGDSWAFAYQANIGLEWKLADNLNFGMRYAFLGTTQLNYGTPTFSFAGLQGTSDIKADALYTHTLMATLRLDF